MEVAGFPVPRGEKLSLLFGSANRDPAQCFAAPDEFASRRRTPPTHRLRRRDSRFIGAPLARIELEGGVRALVERCPNRSCRATKRNPAFVIWGCERVEVATG